MIENSWLPIYDCGQITFVWREGKGFEICNAGTKVYVWQNKSSN